MFKKILQSQINENYIRIIQREAVRAIIIFNNNLLLVHSNKGDFKFPGGGVEENESHSEALFREIKEETGYINCEVKRKIGTVIERKMDEFEHTNLFQMTSHYYLCELTNEETITLQLDDYESILQYSPMWVSIDEAIEQNEKLVHESDQNSWLKRELFVLKELKNL